MPDKNMFMRDYQIKDRQADSPTQGQWFSYGRRMAELAAFSSNNDLSFYIMRRDVIRKLVHIPLYSKTLFVGAGFGFLEETFRHWGYQETASLDNSEYINSNLIHEAHIDVRNNFINADIAGDVSALGAWDFLISEDVVSVLVGTEKQKFYDNCDILASKSIHITNANPVNISRSGYKLQTLRQWHIEKPDHIWIDIVRSKRLG